ncbi:hypothetical protein D3C87_1937810 [compost metagenome]
MGFQQRITLLEQRRLQTEVAQLSFHQQEIGGVIVNQRHAQTRRRQVERLIGLLCRRVKSNLGDRYRQGNLSADAETRVQLNPTAHLFDNFLANRQP